MKGLRMIDPLGYLDFLKLMSEAEIVLTDSGGIQEETTILKVPCLTLRENTERPVTVETGSNQIRRHAIRRGLSRPIGDVDGPGRMRRRRRCGTATPRKESSRFLPSGLRAEDLARHPAETKQVVQKEKRPRQLHHLALDPRRNDHQVGRVRQPVAASLQHSPGDPTTSPPPALLDAHVAQQASLQLVRQAVAPRDPPATFLTGSGTGTPNNSSISSNPTRTIRRFPAF